MEHPSVEEVRAINEERYRRMVDSLKDGLQEYQEDLEEITRKAAWFGFFIGIVCGFVIGRVI